MNRTFGPAAWYKVLRIYSIRQISAAIEWGLSDDDLEELSRLHREKPDLRGKIEDLLTDCNFHTESADWHDGNYVLRDE